MTATPAVRERERAVCWLQEVWALLSVSLARELVAGTMAGLQRQDLEDKLSCAICLDCFTDPVTTPCGHNFCLRCLRDHFDSQSPSGAFDCPTCRAGFERRPEPLCKNLVLDDMVKMMRLRGPEPPPLEGEESGCPAHRKPLDLYCRKDGLCICSVCATKGHKGHDLVTVEEERLQREKELVAKHEEMDRQVKKTEELIDTLKQQNISIKDTASRAKTNYSNKFVMLAKELEEVQAKVFKYITSEECCALERVDSAMGKLEQKCAELREVRLKLETTLKSNNSVQILQFPQEVYTLKNSHQDIVLPASDLAIENKLGGVKKALETISILIAENLQGFFRPAPRSLGIPETIGTDRCVPVKPLEPRPPPSILHIRGPFLQSYRQLRFNPNTAHRFLTLSKDNRRVSHKATQRYPTHPERFEKVWQVLCCEGFDAGRHYWEVQISDQWAYVGVTYKKIDRRDSCSLIGRNNVSWSLQLFSNSYSAWHDSREVKLQPAKYQRVGMHLDCTAGTLAFYGIDSTMTLIHTFHSVFTEPLYPAIWVGENIVATLCQFQ
ncbi:E3 ubiquitin-protein ligase TRIM65-like [Heptranchias perlo]|uniref:E3 ubiquitin-protein ligase TRIM65-like n=1 Tax=Heptranchias perlo TaxID=212740 RepID=UPI00355A8C7A